MRERILIVEDDPAISKLIDTNSTLSGYQTVCAMDGKQAVDAIQAKAGMNPKTLQYLMGHSDITVMLDTYTHLGLEDAAEELKRLAEVEQARKEQEKLNRNRDDDDSSIVVAM